MKLLNRTYRIFALTMAFVMFTSTVNLAIDMHYCQGQLKSVSFFGKAETCHEMMAKSTCPHHQKMMTKKDVCSKTEKNCCDSKSFHIQSDDDQINQISDFAINQELQQFIIAFAEIFFRNIFIEKSNITFTNYNSPKITRDTYVLFETFLL